MHILRGALAALAFAATARAQIHTVLTWEPQHGDSAFDVASWTGFSTHGNICTMACRIEKITPPIVVKPVFLHSTDAGKSWTIQDPGLSNNTSDIFPHVFQIDSLNAIASSDTMGLFRTTDGGNTWRKMNSPLKGGYLDLHFSDTLTGICVAGEGIYTTTDGGYTWNTAQVSVSTWPSSCYSYGNGKFRVFAYGYGPVYTTYNNWKTYDSSAEVVRHDSIVHDKVLAACNFSGGGDTLFAYGADWIGSPATGYGLIMRSTDAGLHWTQAVDIDSLFGVVSCMSKADRDTIFAGGSEADNKILASFDHGFTWHLDTLMLDTDLHQGGCHGLALSNSGNLIACFSPLGPASLMLVRGTFGEASVTPSNGAALDAQLFPNPAMRELSIAGILPHSHVRIADILGRDVLDANASTSGITTIDVSSLVPGLYFVNDGTTHVEFVKN